MRPDIPSPPVADVLGAFSVVQREEAVPCGKAVTTMYYNEAGDLIRQDQHIIVLEGVLSTGTGGI